MQSKTLLVLSTVTIASNIGFWSATYSFKNFGLLSQINYSSVLDKTYSNSFGYQLDDSNEAQPTWMTPSVTWNICTHYFDTDQTIIEVFDYMQYPKRPSFDSRVNTDYDESMILNDRVVEKTLENSSTCSENIEPYETSLSSSSAEPLNFKS